LIAAALVAVFACGSSSLAAQQTSPPRKLGIQVRLGATAFTPLVKDEVRSSAVADSIDADQSTKLSIRQQIAPTVAVAALVPLRDRADLEFSASFAFSGVTGEDD